MANLSNINNKFLFTDGDFLKIGNLAPINNISGTESGISITNSNVASITLDSTAASGKKYVMYSSGNGSLVFWDGDATSARLQIDSSGNVLINSGVYLSWGTNGASSIEGSTVSNKLQFRTNSTNAVIIDSSQNVGIGNFTNPTDGNLVVKKDGLNTGIPNSLTSASFSESGGQLKGLTIGYRTDETTAVIAARTATGDIAFMGYNGGWLETARFTNDNKLGIGTNDPDGKVHIFKGSNGATTVGAASDELILENDTDCGLTIRSAADATGVVSFASPTDHNVGQLYYNHDDDSMVIRTNDAIRTIIGSSGIMYIMGATASTNNSLQLQYNSTAGTAEIYSKSTGGNTTFEFYTSNSGTTTQKFNIGSSGDVKITTNGKFLQGVRNTGSATIDMIGFVSGTDTLQIKGGTSGAANAISFYDTGGFLGTWYNSNFGIGTTSPNKALTVYGSNDNGIWIDSQGAQYTSLAFGNNGTEKANIAWDNTNGYTNITTYANGHLALSTGGRISAFLNSTGNFGVGDTAPTSISVNTYSLSVNSGRNDLSGALVAKANGNIKHQQYWDSSGYSFNITANSGVFKFNGADVQVNANIKANDVSGKFYSMVASWAYVASKNDLFSFAGTEGAVWEYTIKMNPNTAGSGAYRDFYYGKLGIGIGWSGSALTQYIWQQQDQTAPRTLYGSGGGNFNPLFRMYYSGGVYTELAYSTAWTLRIQGLSTTTYGDIFFRRLA